MSEAATIPSLIMMTLIIVSEELLARDTHTQTDTHTDFDLVYLKLFSKSYATLNTKKASEYLRRVSTTRLLR